MTTDDMAGTEAFRTIKRENDALKLEIDKLRKQVKTLKQQLPPAPDRAKV